MIEMKKFIITKCNLHSICWERKEDEFLIPFDGIPYIWFGRRRYQCHQGKDKATSQKRKYNQLKREKMMSDHCSGVKNRKRTQSSKKLCCPVVFEVKKLYRFPQMKINNSNKTSRTKASQALKKLLKGVIDGTQQTFGHLEYITIFPEKGMTPY